MPPDSLLQSGPESGTASCRGIVAACLLPAGSLILTLIWDCRETSRVSITALGGNHVHIMHLEKAFCNRASSHHACVRLCIKQQACHLEQPADCSTRRHAAFNVTVCDRVSSGGTMQQKHCIRQQSVMHIPACNNCDCGPTIQVGGQSCCKMALDIGYGD